MRTRLERFGFPRLRMLSMVMLTGITAEQVQARARYKLASMSFPRFVSGFFTRGISGLATPLE